MKTENGCRCEKDNCVRGTNETDERPPPTVLRAEGEECCIQMTRNQPVIATAGYLLMSLAVRVFADLTRSSSHNALNVSIMQHKNITGWCSTARHRTAGPAHNHRTVFTSYISALVIASALWRQLCVETATTTTGQRSSPQKKWQQQRQQ
uniref:Uncharacterized protein n=1 Tax=Plectus sambesii TaxID=2011161 RepID=A0A914XEF5_9BILA